jgi:uncharacterized coiled-coil DUF342 family protein
MLYSWIWTTCRVADTLREEAMAKSRTSGDYRREIETLRREVKALRSSLQAAESANKALHGLLDATMRRIPPTNVEGSDAKRWKPEGPT